jgi:predicted Rossmann fold nucleotide-binding protein DprA/Smf involved in DNA uptake
LLTKGSVVYLNPETVLSSLELQNINLEKQIMDILKYEPHSLFSLSKKLETNIGLVQKNLLKLILEGGISFDGVHYYI